MRDDDGRQLDRVTLEQVLIRMGPQVAAGRVRAEDAAAALGAGPVDGVRLGGGLPPGRGGRAAAAGGAGPPAQAHAGAAGPLSLPTVGALLHRLGLSPQRPTWRAYEADPEAVARWTTETYPQIRAEAAQAGATVFFADEAGISWDEHAGTT